MLGPGVRSALSFLSRPASSPCGRSRGTEGSARTLRWSPSQPHTFVAPSTTMCSLPSTGREPFCQATGTQCSRSPIWPSGVPAAPEGESDPIEQVRQQAALALGTQIKDYRDTTTDSRQAVPDEGELTFLPSVPGITFNPDRRVFRWLEDVHCEELRLKAAAELDGTTARGRLSVYLGSILLAEVEMAIKVDSQFRALGTKPESAQVDHARPYRRIFASYSHRDVEIVRQFEGFARSFGDRYLRDVVDLRAGEHWGPGLLRLIEEADVFQLFWSTNSMSSEFVQREWEHALSLSRTAFVRPTYWEEPLPETPDHSLPPEALRRLHFHRLAVAVPPQSARELNGAGKASPGEEIEGASDGGGASEVRVGATAQRVHGGTLPYMAPEARGVRVGPTSRSEPSEIGVEKPNHAERSQLPSESFRPAPPAARHRRNSALALGMLMGVLAVALAPSYIIIQKQNEQLLRNNDAAEQASAKYEKRIEELKRTMADPAGKDRLKEALTELHLAMRERDEIKDELAMLRERAMTRDLMNNTARDPMVERAAPDAAPASRSTEAAVATIKELIETAKEERKNLTGAARVRQELQIADLAFIGAAVLRGIRPLPRMSIASSRNPCSTLEKRGRQRPVARRPNC